MVTAILGNTLDKMRREGGFRGSFRDEILIVRSCELLKMIGGGSTSTLGNEESLGQGGAPKQRIFLGRNMVGSLRALTTFLCSGVKQANNLTENYQFQDQQRPTIYSTPVALKPSQVLRIPRSGQNA